jgi:nitroreductase
MDLFDAIHNRRSIRKYDPGPVAPDTIRDILRAAMMAPSAGNEQPWQFVVVTDRGKLAGIREIHPYAGMAAQAPLGILVCGDLSLEKYPGFWVQDCAAAMQNLLLAAHGSGLGAVWTGIYPLEERIRGFRTLFELPAQVIPLGFAVMGFPAQKSPDRYRAERVHADTWGHPWDNQ